MKVYEQNFSTEIFRVSRLSRACLNLFTNCQTCSLAISKQILKLRASQVHCIPQAEIQIHKIVRTRNKNGIKQQLVIWRRYDETFIYWVNSSEIKRKYIMEHFTLHCHQTVPVIIFLATQ